MHYLSRLFLSLVAAALVAGTGAGARADSYSFAPVVLPGISPWAMSPTGIDAEGGIFGVYYDASSVARPFVYAHGTVEDLPRPADGQVFVWNRNAPGTYVGSYSPAGSFQTLGLMMSRRGFLWENGAITRLSLPWPVGGFVARDINAAGTIVGTWWADVFGPNHGYLLTRKGAVSLDYPGSLTTGIAGIDSRGQVVGSATTVDHALFDNGDGTFSDFEIWADHGFVYTRGGYAPVDYPAPAGYTLTFGGTYPWSINERGQALVYVDAYYDNPVTGDEVYVGGYFVATPHP